MGVAPLAVYLRQAGYLVSGEDDSLTDEVRSLLTQAGVVVGRLPDACDLVAYSSAISSSHPVYAQAQTRGVPLVRRGELLAEVTRDKKLVAVCGSHGKTTTTAMLITALRRAGFPAGYVLGGLFADGIPPAAIGANEWIVAEIDESDGTIDRFSPEITTVVNLDWDHPDRYREFAELEATFAALKARTRGVTLVNNACKTSRRITNSFNPAGEANRPAGVAQTLSFGEGGDFSATTISESGERAQLRLGGRFSIAEAVVRARGEFNAANATAALATAQMMGAVLTPALLGDYPGVRRRQAVLHSTDELTVIEDYAHHPAEIRALLGSLRNRVTSGGRLVVVFQPHRFSRTAQFKANFAAALATSDRLFLLEVYPAGESVIEGGTTADVLAELKKSASSVPATLIESDGERLTKELSREVRPRDLVAFVGAGDIERRAREWVDSLRGNSDELVERWDTFVAEVRPKLSAETKLRRDEPLAPKTTMRVGGAARLYAEPANIADLQVLLREARAKGVTVFLLGRGSNLLVPDRGVDGLVISLAHEAWAAYEPRDGGRVWVGAGLRLKNLCGLATKSGLAGFEFLEGIPGSVGGALRMNAGAMGGWMFDVVEEVQLMTWAGEVKMLPKSAMHVGYRMCGELQNAIALGALLRPAARSDSDAVARQIDVYRRKRQESQPREPSAGCIFKNPPDNSAGRLIDESGLKGARVGDAEVSTVHANFIVNRGHATSADVLELIRRVRTEVLAKKGVSLEPEVLLYGANWEDVL
jgi:UDP-N-acetylenolpyruvoylglucosamine reductase